MRLWTAILAGLQIVAAGSVLTELFPTTWVGLFSLLVAAAQGGTIFYMKSEPYQPSHSHSEGS
jgi:hypothetical protein